MKRISDVALGLSLFMATLFLMLILHIMTAQGNTPLVFRPGPGLNDGTDDGSINAGKDAIFYDNNDCQYTGSTGTQPFITGLPRSRCNACNAKAYIQFNISTLPDTVEVVYLGVTHGAHTNYCYSNCVANFYFYPVLEPWSETSIPSSPPLEGTAVYGPINIAFPNDFGNKEYDITDIYRLWKSGLISNNGLVIYSPEGTCNNAAVAFSVGSSDNFDESLRPYLKIIELTPPTVISTNPPGDDTNFATTEVITATFSEEMDASTVTANTFTVRDNNLNTIITGTVSYSGMTATFTPAEPLSYSTTYTATITTGATDLAGNAMAADYPWSFTTIPLRARYASSGMTIDGDLGEASWGVSAEVSKVVDGATDNTARLGVLWDNTYLYVGIKVLDNNLYNDSSKVWHDDSIAVYIDGDHNHSTSYGSHDRRFMKGWNDPLLQERNDQTTGVLHGWASIAGGYTIELAIPWSNLGVVLAEAMTIGLSVGYSDDDNGGNREGRAIWIGSGDISTNPSSLGDVVLADSRAHYAFNEGDGTTAVDSSVYGNDGTISGATWTTGKEGGGLGFNGTNNYVSVPRMNSEEMSVSAWFSKDAIDLSYTDAVVGGFRNDQNLQLREGFEVAFNPSSPHSLDFMLITRDGSGIRTSRTTRRNLVNSVGSWYHAVGTYQKATGQQKLYVNGELVRTVTHPAGNTVVPMTYYPEIVIGHSVATTGYFSGSIDDVRLYDRVLSDREIKGLYHAFTSEQQARYALDENTGTIANDSSGNGNHGSVNGGATWTTGRYGGGLGFDGINDYVSIPRINNDEVSVCVWFKKNVNDTARNDAVFGAYRHNSSIPLREGFEVRFAAASPNTLDFVLVTQDGSGIKTARTAQMNLVNLVGSWYHATGTYNKTTGEQKLYVNGQLLSTQMHPVGNTIVPLSAYADMRIGYSRVNAGYFNGILDDVRLYRRPLNDQEVLDVYNGL